MNCIKKITTLILALAFFVPCGVISACERNAEPPTTNGPEEPAPEEETPPAEEEVESGTDPDDPNKLKTPTLTMDANVARWKAIEFATKYVYKRGESGAEKETTGLYVTLMDGQTLYVKAVGGEYKDSDWAQITYEYTDPYIAPSEWSRNPGP